MICTKKITALITVLILGISSLIGQDSIFINGAVLNSSNMPIPNVSVGIVGAKEMPAVSNENGRFSLVAASGSVWINVAPSEKYKKKTVYLNGRSQLVIYLTPFGTPSGEDKLTVLSQEVTKRDMIASFTSVNTSQIVETPVLTLDQFFQGRVSGINVVNRSGDPGSGAISLFHGINSISASNSPLYIVDGIPLMSPGVFENQLDGYEYNPLLNLNPLDISKATVIKDPTILAAYGSKASNGLIIVETLDPSATKTSIELDLRRGFSLQPSNKLPQLSAGQHRSLISELLFSSGIPEEQVLEDYPNLFLVEGDERYIDYQHNTNWQDQIFTNSAFNNLNVKVKGGDEIARFGLSFGYMENKGIIKNTGYDGYNLRFLSLLNIFTWLKMNANVSLSYNNSEFKESARISQTSPLYTSLAKSPMLNPYQYDSEGKEVYLLSEPDELGISNPQAVVDNFEAKANNFNLVAALGFSAGISDDLALNTKFGITTNVLKELIFKPNIGMESYSNTEAINTSISTNNALKSFYNNSYLNYNTSLGNNHVLLSNTGVNIQSSTYELDWGLTKNSHQNDEYRMIQDGQNDLREIGGANRNWSWISFYEYVRYSYKDKYMASATVSLDGSSRLGKNAANTLKIGSVPFGLFYSVGGVWRISNEAFLKNITKLDELKLRVSYGTSGNDRIGESTSTSYYSAVKFRETSGLVPAVVVNDQLTYETVSQLNGGLDVSLWGSKLQANIDIYKSRIDNLLVFAPIAPHFGFEFRPENGGAMQNKGMDVSLFYRVVDQANFTWDVQVSYSAVKNKVLSVKGDTLITKLHVAEVVNMPGEQANSFYGYVYEGVYSTSQEAADAGLVNDKYQAYHAGDAIFQDISGPNGHPDGVINDYDKTIIGSSLPESFGGIRNTFTYKRWSLNVFMQFVAGNEVFNYLRYTNENMLGLGNQSTNVLNRWVSEGQHTNVPRALYGDYIGNSAFSTRWIEDGSYFRVKNISLSYSIPKEFLAFQNALFYISATNLFTVSKYLGYDPEFAFSSSHLTHGIDYGLTPQYRQFIAGIKLGL